MIVYKRLTDKEKISEICELISKENLYEPTGDFQNWVGLPNSLSCVLVAFDGNRLVGYALARPYHTDWKYNAGVYIVPSYRRRGIGTELMSRMQNVECKLVVDIYKNECKQNFFAHVEKTTGKNFYVKY